MAKVMRISDYCNAKYQGQTINNLPHGFGLLIDDNFTFVASQWSNGKITSPTLVVFDNSSIIYGQINEQKQGLIVFSNSNLTVYRYDRSIVVDFPQNRQILKLQRRKETRELKTMERKPYKSQEQKYQLIEDLLKTRIPEHYRSYQSFTFESFKKTQLYFPSSHKNQDRSQTPKRSKFVLPKSVFTISYKKESIFLKMLEKYHKIDSLGYSLDVGVGEFEVRRKYFFQDPEDSKWKITQEIRTEIGDQIHEFNGTQSEKANTRSIFNQFLPVNDQKRKEEKILFNENLKKSKKMLKKYFKSSLSYVNKFINIKYLYTLHAENNEIRDMFLLMASESNHGQVKIERGRYLEEEEVEEDDIKSQKVLQVSHNDIKKELQRVRKYNGSKSPYRNANYPSQSPSAAYSPSRSRVSQIDYSRRTKITPYQSPPRKYENQFEPKSNQDLRISLKKQESKRYPNYQRTPTRTPYRRGLETNNNNSKNNNQEIQSYSRKVNNFQVEQEASKISSMQEKENRNYRDPRYSYLQETNRDRYGENRKKQAQNIDNLIGKYKNLDNEIKSQTPNNNQKQKYLNQSPYRYNYMQQVETPKNANFTAIREEKNRGRTNYLNSRY